LIGGYALLTAAGVVFGVPDMVAVAIVLAAVTGLLLLYKSYRLGVILHHVLEIVAQSLNLVPADKRPPPPSTGSGPATTSGPSKGSG
jgi:hypothetical protein